MSPYVQNLGETGPPLRSTYRHLACEHQKVREGGYHEMHEARIQVQGSPCSSGFLKTSRNFSQDVVCKYPEYHIVERSIVAL